MIFLTLIFSTFSSAADVTCWNSDCLKSGWTSSSPQTSIDYACYRDGCDQSGWITQNSYTQCKDQACFGKGWYQVSSQTQSLERDVVCGVQGPEASCMKYGWTAYSPRSGQLFTVRCRNESCDKIGWTVQSIVGGILQVTCKSDGCFQSGWTEY